MFIENNIDGKLPYNRKKYISGIGWYGCSFQLPGGFEGRNIDIEEYLNAYDTWFKDVILQFNKNSYWIVNHGVIDDEWLPDKTDTLQSLKILFKQNNIPNTFKGALIFTSEELLKITKDLITYPFLVLEDGSLYEDLDISNEKLPFVIKISAHMNVDLLSTNKALLNKITGVVSKAIFIKKEYSQR